MGRKEMTPEQRAVLLAERLFREQERRRPCPGDAPAPPRSVLPGLPVPVAETAVAGREASSTSPVGRGRSDAPGEGAGAVEAARPSPDDQPELLTPALSLGERGDAPEAAVPVADPAQVAGLVAQTPRGDRRALIARLYRAFEGQVAQMEARLGELLGAGSLAEIDQTVKTLASLAKTLTMLMDLQKDQAEDGGDDDRPDPDALRAQLADRLGRLCTGRAD